MKVKQEFFMPKYEVNEIELEEVLNEIKVLLKHGATVRINFNGTYQKISK